MSKKKEKDVIIDHLILILCYWCGHRWLENIDVEVIGQDQVICPFCGQVFEIL